MDSIIKPSRIRLLEFEIESFDKGFCKKIDFLDFHVLTTEAIKI